MFENIYSRKAAGMAGIILLKISDEMAGWLLFRWKRHNLRRLMMRNDELSICCRERWARRINASSWCSKYKHHALRPSSNINIAAFHRYDIGCQLHERPFHISRHYRAFRAASKHHSLNRNQKCSWRKKRGHYTAKLRNLLIENAEMTRQSYFENN